MLIWLSNHNKHSSIWYFIILRFKNSFTLLGPTYVRHQAGRMPPCLSCLPAQTVIFCWLLCDRFCGSAALRCSRPRPQTKSRVDSAWLTTWIHSKEWNQMRTLPDFRRNLDFAERVAFSKPGEWDARGWGSSMNDTITEWIYPKRRYHPSTNKC